MSCVAPPPRLPHPAAVPFTSPIILLLNIVLIQNWQETNVASEKPMKNRARMNPEMVDTDAMEKTAGAANMIRNAHPYRGPTRSHRGPMSSRERTEPDISTRQRLSMSASFRHFGYMGNEDLTPILHTSTHENTLSF